MRSRRGVLRSFAKRTHSTLNRWVLKYAPELDKRIPPFLNPTNNSWRVDETYIEVKGEWKYLYRAVDSGVYRLKYAGLKSRCQQIKQRNSKLAKFLKPYPERLINFNLLLMPST